MNLASVAGPVIKVVVFNESQALIQMESVAHAKTLLDRFQGDVVAGCRGSFLMRHDAVTPATLRGKRIRLQYSLQHEVVSTGNQKNVYVNPYLAQQQPTGPGGVAQTSSPASVISVGPANAVTIGQSHTPPPAMSLSTIITPGQPYSGVHQHPPPQQMQYPHSGSGAQTPTGQGNNPLHVSSSSPSLLLSAFQPRGSVSGRENLPQVLTTPIVGHGNSGGIHSPGGPHSAAVGDGRDRSQSLGANLPSSMSTPSLSSLVQHGRHRSRSPSDRRKVWFPRLVCC